MVQALTPQQAHQLIEAGDVEVIDVREPREWSDGHLAGARLVPLGQLRGNPRGTIRRDDVIFVCGAGVRSETAARLAASLGFARVYNLTGGTRAWGRAGFPLVNELSLAV